MGIVEGRGVPEGAKGEVSQGVSTSLEGDVLLQRKVNLEEIRQRLRRLLEPESGAFFGSEVAPLIFFPEEDEGELKIKKKSALKRADMWTEEYMDKRAQAKWMGENLGLAENMPPKPEFRSRYADPNHPAANGDFVGLLSGGRWQSGGRKEKDRGGEGSSGQIEEDGEPSKKRGEHKASMLSGLLKQVRRSLILAI